MLHQISHNYRIPTYFELYDIFSLKSIQTEVIIFCFQKILTGIFLKNKEYSEINRTWFLRLREILSSWVHSLENQSEQYNKISPILIGYRECYGNTEECKKLVEKLRISLPSNHSIMRQLGCSEKKEVLKPINVSHFSLSV